MENWDFADDFTPEGDKLFSFFQLCVSLFLMADFFGLLSLKCAIVDEKLRHVLDYLTDVYYDEMNTRWAEQKDPRLGQPEFVWVVIQAAKLAYEEDGANVVLMPVHKMFLRFFRKIRFRPLTIPDIKRLVLHDAPPNFLVDMLEGLAIEVAVGDATRAL